MSIKHALLGLIAAEPMHGYRLKATFDHRVSALWGLTTAQIYQTLNALERGGLLASRGERVGSRPARRIYSLTGAGKRALDRWLDAVPSPWMAPFRADMLIRLLFLRETDVAMLCGVLDRQEQDVLHLRERVTRMPHGAPRDGTIDVVGLFLDGITHRIDADLTLLRRCRGELAKWSRVRKLAMPTPTLAPLGARRAATPAPPVRNRRVAAR
jgi:DNA-binding PadR family transcriptional regulator